MSHGLFGSNNDKTPNAVWPYWDTDEDLEEVIQNSENFDNAIEPDGKGGYRWREQPLQS